MSRVSETSNTTSSPSRYLTIVTTRVFLAQSNTFNPTTASKLTVSCPTTSERGLLSRDLTQTSRVDPARTIVVVSMNIAVPSIAPTPVQ